MFSKIKKYVIGFFVLAGGILFAFLSGKSAGRKELEAWIDEQHKLNQKKVYDMSVANAMANENVSMEINKNKTM